jgi:hypothetical protein
MRRSIASAGIGRAQSSDALIEIVSRFFRSGRCFPGRASPPRPEPPPLYTMRARHACCASHSLAEVYSTLTRLPLPHRATPGQAIEFLESIQSRFRLVSLEGADYLAGIREAATNRISGGAIYDALIARCAARRALIRYSRGTSATTNCWVQKFPNASRALSSTDWTLLSRLLIIRYAPGSGSHYSR